MRPALLLPLLLGACTAGKEVDPGDTSGENGDFTEVYVRLSDVVSTAVFVTWELDATPDRAWIEYGADASYGKEAPARSATEALVLGEPAATEIHLRVVADVGGELLYSGDQVITTGAVPGDVPVHEAVDHAPDVDYGNFFLTSYYNAGPGTGGVIIVNRAGETVWYTPPQAGFVPAAKVARDGKGIHYLWAESVNETADARICRVDLSGEGETCRDTPYAHHDFWELADGSFTYPKEEYITWNGYELVGDQLVNRTKDGVETIYWASSEEITPVPEQSWNQHMTPHGVDWTHVNGMWYDEAEDTYYLSFFFFEEIRKIPVALGASEWVLGGADGQFTFVGDPFGPQHAPQLIDGGILLFDNDESGAGGSRVASYLLDEDARVATADISWRHPEGRRAAVMGDAHLLPDGYMASAFGDAGSFIVWDPDGNVLWEDAPPAGVSSCQAYVYRDLYTMEPN